jgi:S1-C subfamily serine protease
MKNVLLDFARAGNRILSLIILAASFAACKAQPGIMKFSSGQPQPQPVVSSSDGSVQNSYADLVGRVSPAVVTVHSTERTRAAQQFPFFDDPLFRDFFW